MRKIIAFCGVKQSGKDTACNTLKDNFKDIISITLAGKLKDVCSEVFNIPRGVFEDGKLKEKEIDPPRFLTQENIEKVIQLYDIPYDFDLHVRQHIGYVLDTPRKVLQYVGTEVLKNIDTNIHCDAAVKNLPKDGIFVVTDLRFPNEGTYFENYDCEFYPYFINRTSSEIIALRDKHPSEQLIFETAKNCKVLDNNKNQIDFELLVVKTVKEIICPI